ncbi:MAG: hypothetical protein LBF00_00655 [Mycoplasmataceae bacterium]|nr:hypothetical protein [Mycoplasmataceae bacterium]
MGLLHQKHHLTKNITTLLLCGAVLIGFILVWLLLADMNLLQLQWLIPYNGKEWSGNITQSNYHNVFTTYQKDILYWSNKNGWNVTDAQSFYNFANTQYPNGLTILSSELKFNAWILLPIIIIAFISFVIPLILHLFKLMYIDTYIFSIPITLAAITYIFCGLIPSVNNNGWLIFARIVIFFAVLIILFIVCNRVINTIIGYSASNEQMIIDITSQERERSQSRATLQKLKDEYKKQDDLTHIDISKDD